MSDSLIVVRGRKQNEVEATILDLRIRAMLTNHCIPVTDVSVNKDTNEHVALIVNEIKRSLDAAAR